MGIVYFFRQRDQNLFKIGRTIYVPERRRATLQIGNPERVDLFHSLVTDHHVQVELYLHHMLADRKTLGEWFSITEDEARDAIQHGETFARNYEEKNVKVEALCTLEATSGEEVPYSPDILKIHLQLKQAKQQKHAIEYEIELLENELKLAIGENDGIKEVATWRVQKRTSFDRARLEKEQPEVYRRYVCQKHMRVFRLK